MQNEKKTMDICISEDTIAKAREAKDDQGNHETEVSFNGESDLHRSYVMCDKNKDHKNFVPITDLALNNLPPSVKEKLILDFVRIKANETVRLSSSFTSDARPEGYIFSKYKGNRMIRVGSGRVWAVYKDTIKADIPCPFVDCKEVEGHHFVSGYLRIHTAMHVVFDDEEAKNTTVDFFYDIPGDRSTVITARGVRVIKSDIIGDFCVMECVTHDPQLCLTLDSVRQKWMSLWPALSERLYGYDLSMVISHPHGCSKQVSFGECVKREWKKFSDGQSYYRYAFTAATCPGCSGAPVWVPGSEGLISTYASHSKHIGNGVGMSAFWFLWKTNEQEK